MLRSRLLLSYVGLTLVCTLATGVFVHARVRETQAADERDLLVTVAGAVDAATAGFRAKNDDAGLGKLVREFGDVAQCRITIIARDGRVLAETDRDPQAMENHLLRPEIQAARPGSPGVVRRRSATTGREHLYVATVSPAGDAFVRVAAHVDRLEEKLDHINRDLLAGLAVQMVAAVLLGFFVAGKLTGRIERLSDSAARILAGDFAARNDVRNAGGRGDEIDAVGRVLNGVAERLAAQIAELEARRRETSDVLDSVADGLIAVNADDVVTHVNPQASRWFEAGASAVGRPFWEAVRDSALPDLTAKVRASGRPAEADLSLDRPPVRRALEVRVSPIHGPKDEYRGAVLAFRDVTRLRRLEGVRRDFVANVSHEMKTPLTSIQGYVETLQGGALQDAELAPQFLAKIERNARSLAHLVTDLLVLSRVEAGGVQVAAEPFPVADVVHEAAAACADKAREKGLAFTVAEPVVDASVLGDPDLLVRALVNLLDNAIQYTSSGGRVELSTAVADGKIAIRVRDTGIGIPAGDRERVFERFYRVDKARSRALGGTGLGLAIVKHVAEQHGGAVSVESEYGRGSVFTLSLPAVVPAP